MYMLDMRFHIPWLAAKLLLCGRDGRVNINKVEAYYDRELLEELRDFPGLKWKLWSISENGLHGSGFYLFGDEASARVRERYAKKFYWRKGLLFCRCHISEVVEGCSRFTRAPIDVPANPAVTEEQERRLMHFKAEAPIKKLKAKYQILKGVK